MFKTIAFGAALLSTALAGPAIYYSAPDYWKSVRREWLPGTPAAGGSAGGASSDATTGQLAAGPRELPLEGAPVRELAEVFRFDVTVDWVLSRWPRVSTGLGYLQFQGYRVPLVTGIDESDLAGSLTYYFSPQQRVQRITFRGTTGDAQKLVKLLVTRYKFTRRLTNDPGLFIYEAASPDGQPSGVLKITSAQVVKSSAPNRRFDVELFIQRS